MKCKKFFAAAAACLMVAGFAACGNEPTPVNPDEKVFQIGIVQLVEHNALDEATRGFQEFLTEKLGDKVQFNVQNAQGEQTPPLSISSFPPRSISSWPMPPMP